MKIKKRKKREVQNRDAPASFSVRNRILKRVGKVPCREVTVTKGSASGGNYKFQVGRRWRTSALSYIPPCGRLVKSNQR